MPKIRQLISVKVSDKGRLNDRRRIIFEVNATADLFNLSDFMDREGALKRFRQPAADALRTALANYIRSGRDSVKAVERRKERPI